MKNTTMKLFALLLVPVCIFALSACAGNKDPWKDARYTEDITLGTGAKSIQVSVKVNENQVNFTILTDQTTLGGALREHALIEGEEGEFGLYVKKVNGVLADYDVDKTFWSFYQDGNYMLVGVDSAEILGGEQFEIVYSK